MKGIFNKKAVLSQGEPCDAAVNLGYVSDFTTAACVFSATSRLSYRMEGTGVIAGLLVRVPTTRSSIVIWLILLT